MKKMTLSIIVFFLVCTAVKADNSNVKIKLLSESENSSNSSTSWEKSLSGIGFELYHKLSQSSEPVFNQEKSSQEKRLEKIYEKLHSDFKKNPTKSAEQDLKKLIKRLKKAREKRKQQTEKEDRVSQTIESIGFILEAKTLGGQITYSNSSEITNVQKNIFEIGIMIAW